MRVIKSSLQQQVTNPANNSNNVSVSANAINIVSSNNSNNFHNEADQLSFFNDFVGDLVEVNTSTNASSSSESLTLYKSDDFDDESIGTVAISGGGSGDITQAFNNEFSAITSVRAPTPTRAIAIQRNNSSEFNVPSGFAVPDKQKITKNATPRNLKRTSSALEHSSSNIPPTPIAVNKKPPKYQFDTATDFLNHHGNASVAASAPNVNLGIRVDTPKKSPKPKSTSTRTTNAAKTKNSNNNVDDNEIIGPSTSFNPISISIPSTSKTPATTMYLPFTGRKQSLKSHELDAAKLKFLHFPELTEEQEARRFRVESALEDLTEEKGLKYFVEKNIEEYLERRGYAPPYLDKVITKGIFASIIPIESSAAGNSITFGPQYEAQEIIGEIEKFWEFYLALKENDPEMSIELKPVLIPMLLYFYLECFVSGLVPVALRLYVEFSKKFLTEDATQESYDILFTIATITSPDSFDDNEHLQAFRRQERRFLLSLDTFKRLKKFIISSTTRCPLMLHLFSSRFTIQIKDSAAVAEIFIEPPWEESPKRKEFRGSEAVYNVIRRLRDAPNADLPSMSLFLTNGRPVCGAISPSGTTFAYGMADGAGIQLGFSSESVLATFNSERQKIGESCRKLEMLNTLTAKDHTGSIYDLAFHPKTKRLFSVGQDCTLRAWDLNKLSCKAVYRGHSLPIGCLDISESGIMVATGSMDTTAKIWLPEQADYVRLLAGHYLDVTSIKFHPNEAYIATGSQDTSVRLWSVSDGNMVRVFTGFRGRITSLAFHENGKFLIAGGSDSFVRIYDIGEGEVLAELPSPSNCTSLALDQNTLAASFGHNKVRLWNLKQIINGSTNNLELDSDSESEENSRNRFQLPSSARISTESNSLLRLHFTNPRHIVGLGEECDTVPESTSPSSAGRQAEVKKHKRQESHEVSARPKNLWDEVGKLLPEMDATIEDIEFPGSVLSFCKI